jgi:hypothetical protein
VRWIGIAALAVMVALSGCTTVDNQQVANSIHASNIVAGLEGRSFSADELGIQMVGQPGKQTIRWKETITPREPTVVPLLAADRASVQPRVAVSVNGGLPMPVSIDSGAALNLFNAELAATHGLKVADPKNFGNVFEGLGGQEYAYYGMIDQLVAGNLTIRNVFTALRIPSPGLPEQVDNVLGMTTLAKFSYVTIDFPRREALFALEGKYAPERFIRAECPFILHSLQLILEVQINGTHAVNVLLDTGNDAALLLPESILEKLELTGQAKNGKKGKLLGLGGVVETRTFRIESLSLGSHHFSSVEVTAVPNAFPPALGSGFLRQFRTTLDFERGRLWLEQ